MSDQSYNGYTNYATWCVSLWWDNDQGQHEYILERISDVIGDDGAYGVAKELEEILDQEREEYGSSTGLFADLLTWAIGQVDWFDLAENWVDTWLDYNDLELIWSDDRHGGAEFDVDGMHFASRADLVAWLEDCDDGLVYITDKKIYADQERVDTLHELIAEAGEAD